MERDAYFDDTGIYVPLICDGGIVNPKDIAMAYAFGADVVMMGRWFARLDESPTDVIIRGGQRMKPYWGEGSARARSWQRYVEGGGDKMPFAEGVEGCVPHAGPLSANLQDALSKMSAFFCDNARLSIMEMHKSPIHVERVSMASIKEGRAHDILVEPSGDMLYSDRLGTYREKEWSPDKVA